MIRFVASKILKLTLTFLSSHFPMWAKTSWQKFKYLKKEKKEKALIAIFIGLSLTQINPLFLESENTTFNFLLTCFLKDFNCVFIKQSLPIKLEEWRIYWTTTGKRYQSINWSENWLEALQMNLAILQFNFCWLALNGCNYCFIRQKIDGFNGQKKDGFNGQWQKNEVRNFQAFRSSEGEDFHY